MSDPTRPIDLTCDDVRELAGAFVLGALEPADEAAVRAHLASCLDAHAEIAEVGSVLPALDASVPLVEPPAALKTRIMAAAAADLASRRDAGIRSSASPAPFVAETAGAVAETAAAEPSRMAAVAPATPADNSDARTVAFPSAEERAARAERRSTPLAWLARIAAVLVIVALGGWNLLLQGQLQTARSYEQNVAAVLDIAGQAGSLTAVLTPKDGSGPAGFAAVSAAGKVSMAMRDLAPTVGDQVYEAWVISDGVPVAIGGFKVGSAGTAFFETTGVPSRAGIVLALTIEAAPGATAPSGPPITLGTATAG